MKRYKRLLQQHGEEYSQKELYDHLSEAMDIPVDEIKRIVQLNSTSVIVMMERKLIYGII